MKDISTIMLSIMKQLPQKAQNQLIPQLTISNEIDASPAGAILMGMHILEYVGFARYVDQLLGLSAVLSGFGIGINRIAFVLFSRLNLLDSGTRFIQDLYLNSDKLQDISGAETHWLVYSNISGEEINRCRLK